MLGSLVAVREGVYALSVLACVAVNPAFLLVNARATARNEDNVYNTLKAGYTWLAMYVPWRTAASTEAKQTRAGGLV